jgi:hypothetical protein
VIHSFVCNGDYFIFESESGALLEIDALAYYIINKLDIPKEYSIAEIEETKQELNEL